MIGIKKQPTQEKNERRNACGITMDSAGFISQRTNHKTYHIMVGKYSLKDIDEQIKTITLLF